jgi:hypothetical protein
MAESLLKVEIGKIVDVSFATGFGCPPSAYSAPSLSAEYQGLHAFPIAFVVAIVIIYCVDGCTLCV